MIKVRLRKIGIFLLLVCLPFGATGQTTVFRTWWAAELRGELFNLVDFAVTPELRFFDNSSRFESVQIELDASVPITKWFRLGGMYRHQTDVIRSDQPKYVNRFNGYAKFDTKVERLRMAYRIMYQQEYENMNISEEGKIPDIQHRHKVSFKYRPKGWDITPVLAGEMFFTVAPEWRKYQQKLRLTAGIEYRLTKKMDLGLAYKFQQEYYEDDPVTSNIIAVKFSYQL